MHRARVEEVRVPEWLRDPALSSTAEARAELEDSLRRNGPLESHPIVVWSRPDGRWVVCGRERVEACMRLGMPELWAEEREFASEGDARAFALRENLGRRHVTPAQRFEILVRLGELELAAEDAAPDLPPARRAAALLGVASSTCRQFGEVRAGAPDLWSNVLEGSLSIHVAAKRMRWRAARARYGEQLRAGGEIDLEAEGLIEPTNVWSWSEPDPAFGGPTRGRLPGQAAALLLHYWTERGGVVVDPFAGSGTVLDAARYMGRQCRATDLTSIRADVARACAVEHVERPIGGAHLAIVDPPWWGQFAAPKPWSDDPRDLGNVADLLEWRKRMRRVLQNCARSLRGDGRLAVVVSPTHQGLALDHLPWLLAALANMALEVEARVVLRTPEREWGGPERERALARRRPLKAFREVVVARHAPLGRSFAAGLAPRSTAAREGA